MMLANGSNKDSEGAVALPAHHISGFSFSLIPCGDEQGLLNSGPRCGVRGSAFHLSEHILKFWESVGQLGSPCCQPCAL